MIDISIIVPVYNVKEYIRRCVASVVEACSTLNHEIVLVDDGSTDGSGLLCDDLAVENDKIHVVHKENGGLASARNAGLNVATGKYVSFVDSDDWIDSRAYVTALQIMENESVDVIEFGYERVRDGRCLFTYTSSWEKGLYTVDGIRKKLLPDFINPEQLFEYDKTKRIMSSCMHIYRRQLIDDNNIRFTSERVVLNEDYLFLLNVLLCAQKYYVTHFCWYYYDTRDGSLTQRYKSSLYERKLALLKEYKKVLRKHKCLNRFKNRLALFHINNMYAAITNECWDSKVDYSRVRMILNDKQLLQDYRMINYNNQTVKTKMILAFMRLKMVHLICFVYRLMFRISNR